MSFDPNYVNPTGEYAPDPIPSGVADIAQNYYNKPNTIYAGPNGTVSHVNPASLLPSAPTTYGANQSDPRQYNEQQLASAFDMLRGQGLNTQQLIDRSSQFGIDQALVNRLLGSGTTTPAPLPKPNIAIDYAPGTQFNPDGSVNYGPSNRPVLYGEQDIPPGLGDLAETYGGLSKPAMPVFPVAPSNRPVLYGEESAPASGSNRPVIYGTEDYNRVSGQSKPAMPVFPVAPTPSVGGQSKPQMPVFPVAPSNRPVLYGEQDRPRINPTYIGPNGTVGHTPTNRPVLYGEDDYPILPSRPASKASPGQMISPLAALKKLMMQRR